MNKPERAHVLILKIEADDINSLVGVLRSIEADFILGKQSSQSTMGGASGSHVYNYRKNDITHDEYFVALEKELEKMRDASN